jgi:hypothetical protein
MSGTVIVTARPSTVTVSASFKRPATGEPEPPETTVAFNLTAEVAIDEGTVNLLPKVTVMVPPTGISLSPPEPPETAMVY